MGRSTSSTKPTRRGKDEGMNQIDTIKQALKVFKDKREAEFIAYKHTKKSSWGFCEFSDKNDESIEAIAPDAGNYKKVYLIESSNHQSKLVEACEVLMEALEYYSRTDLIMKDLGVEESDIEIGSEATSALTRAAEILKGCGE